MDYNDYSIHFGKVKRKGADVEELDVLLTLPDRNVMVWLVSTLKDEVWTHSGYAARGRSIRRVQIHAGNSEEDLHRTSLILASAVENLVIYEGRKNGDGPTHRDAQAAIRAVRSGAVDGAMSMDTARALRTPITFDSPLRDMLRPVNGALGVTSSVNITGVNDLVDGFTARKVAKTLQVRKKRAGSAIEGPVVTDLDEATAQAALRAIPKPSAYAVEFYGVLAEPEPEGLIERDGRKFVLDGEREREYLTRPVRRQRAAEGMPILAETMATDMDLARAIDTDGPLFTMIRDMTGLSKGALKTLRGVSKIPEDVNVEHVEVRDALGNIVAPENVQKARPFDLQAAFRAIASLPPEWCPGSAEEWADFRDVMTAVIIPVSDAFGVNPEEVLRGQHKKMGGWSGLRKTLGNAIGAEADDVLDQARLSYLTRDAIRTVRQFGSDVVMPVLAEAAIAAGTRLEPSQEILEKIDETALQIVMAHAPQKGSPYARLFSALRTFMPRSMILNGSRKMDGNGNATEWDFPLVRQEVFRASNGVSFRQLSSFQDMDEHGTMQNNCITWDYNKTLAETMDNAFYEVADPYYRPGERRREMSDISSLRFYIGTAPQSYASVCGRKLSKSGTRGAVGFSEFRTTAGTMQNQPDAKASHVAAAIEFLNSFSVEEIDQLVDRQAEQKEKIRARGATYANGYAQTETVEAFVTKTWGVISGVSIGERSVDAVWREWSGQILSGLPENNRAVLSDMPAIRSLLETARVAPARAENGPGEP